MRDKGTILRLCGNKDMEVYVDAGFSGNWYGADYRNRDIARSRNLYIIIYEG